MPGQDQTEDTDDMSQFVPETTTRGRSANERQLPNFPATGQRRFASFSSVAGRAETAALVRTQREIQNNEDQRERDAKAG